MSRPLIRPDIVLLEDLLLSAADRMGAAPALLNDGRTWSFSQVCESAHSYAAALLAAEVEPGNRVALLMENGADYVAAYFGAFLAGAVAVPLDARLEPGSLRSLLLDSQSHLLITSHRQLSRIRKALPLLPDLEWMILPSRFSGQLDAIKILTADCFQPASVHLEKDPDSPAVINYTSGSSGSPKGVVVSHRAILANTRSIVSYLGLNSTDRMMQILPFSYCYGASLLHTHFMAGGSVVIDNRFFTRVLYWKT